MIKKDEEATPRKDCPRECPLYKNVVEGFNKIESSIDNMTLVLNDIVKLNEPHASQRVKTWLNTLKH